jgi:hypothetical protein
VPITLVGFHPAFTTNWQVEPDLVELREPHALDELSADERKECLALWQAVGNLLRRARDGQ